MRTLTLLLLLLLTISDVKAADSLRTEKPHRSWLARLVDSFSEVDTNYVEPQHYNWSLMLQSAYDFEFYHLRTSNENLKQSITFAPEPVIKIGPYFGWRWIFLGYNFDLRSLQFGGGRFLSEIAGSIYSSRFGIDVYYRRTSDDYKIREVNLGDGIDTGKLKGQPFNGMKVSITGANLYYIFNHRRFSYPAAFSQSTCQKISCGSWMAGIGYLNNTIEFDHHKLEQQIIDTYPNEKVELDSGFMFNKVKYFDIDASVGYAYNWVFARNWLLTASLSMAVAYKGASGETAYREESGFNFKNFNVDGVGRFSLLWNNVKWYGGVNAIVRTYSYHNDRFATNNILGNVYLFFGVNFGLRKEYRKKR